jgi:tetratricopeptide (TPR) repeat protein
VHVKNLFGRHSRAVKAAALFVTVTTTLCACSRKVSTGAQEDAPVPANGNIAGGNQTLAQAAEQQPMAGNTHFDMAAEDAIANSCIHAWRKAVNDQDEKAAMAELLSLEAKYPQVSTIPLMMGQVKTHFKKNKEAIFFFEKALKGSEFSTMHRIKLAQAYKNDGQYAKAVKQYEQILKRAAGNPVFDSIREELAFCEKKLGKSPSGSEKSESRDAKKTKSLTER